MQRKEVTVLPTEGNRTPPLPPQPLHREVTSHTPDGGNPWERGGGTHSSFLPHHPPFQPWDARTLLALSSPTSSSGMVSLFFSTNPSH